MTAEYFIAEVIRAFGIGSGLAIVVLVGTSIGWAPIVWLRSLLRA